MSSARCISSGSGRIGEFTAPTSRELAPCTALGAEPLEQVDAANRRAAFDHSDEPSRRNVYALSASAGFEIRIADVVRIAELALFARALLFTVALQVALPRME